MTSVTPQVSIKNRRRFIRVPANCKVAAQKILFFARGDLEIWGEAKNLGAGGILFTSRQQCCKDDMLKVTLTLSSFADDSPLAASLSKQTQETPVTAVCQVLRSRKLPTGGFELAVKFVNIFRDEMHVLKEFVESEAERLGVVS
jgi:hypothetical protein